MSTTLDNILSIIPDKLYLQLKYFYRFHKFPNLKNPKTYNEKLQWLKLNDRNPIYTTMADKYEAKQYVSKIIGDKYIVPTYGVWDKFEDIDFDKLPNQFVLKCTHDSGGIVICKDKNKLDISKAKEKINKSLNTNYYYHSREWPYKNIKPRIIVEKYMEDESGALTDYKFFSFDGETKALYVATDRQSSEETKFDFYDDKFNHLDLVNSHPNSLKENKKPKQFEEMISLANKLSKGYPHIRVDFYEVNNEIYFGELTFYHMSGFQPFYPEKWDYTFGEWINLKNEK
ncbi:MAG: ATP-grasp fold amidoligase family protein [Erysipelotrichaceae bacterium]|nr:ATP-grasp fold amidoligase family protein [Erysipelotrichaceae bacterium]